MTSFAFQQQLTWRKLGYLFFTNSLSYREVLEQNRQWNVTELPPVGAQLVVNGSEAGRSNNGIIGTTLTPAQQTGEDPAQTIYPFNTPAEYEQAVDRYNLYGVLYRESLNGYSADSEAAATGKQD
jgi:hypothetical protein